MNASAAIMRERKREREREYERERERERERMREDREVEREREKERMPVRQFCARASALPASTEHMMVPPDHMWPHQTI